MSRVSVRNQPSRVRIDDLLVSRGEAPDLTTARALILSGRVHGVHAKYIQAGQRLPSDATLTVRASRRYVSRGGEKLAAALDAWSIAVASRVCLDVGASTGGFTDALLQRRAAHVYAVDVGYGQLAESLRHNQRVISMERTHIRELPALPQQPSLSTIDVSFIGLQQVLPCVAAAVEPRSDVVALVKPQFEAPATDVNEHGVVVNPRAQGRAVSAVVNWAFRHDWRVGGVLRSPLLGPAGNHEYFVWLRTP